MSSAPQQPSLEVTHPIRPVEMATAAILGYAQRGPTWPQVVNSWQDFVHWYGGHTHQGHMPYCVEGYFRNGGRRCYIVRVVGADAAFAELELPPLRLRAIGPGEWGNRLAARLRQTGDARFRLTVRYWNEDPPADLNAPRPRNLPDLEEIFDHLVLDPASPDYVLTRLAKGQSRLVMAEWIEGQKPAIPRPRDFVLFRGGADGRSVPTTRDFIGQMHQQPHLRRGLSTLREIPDIGTVCAAENVWDEGISLALIGHCSDPTLGRMALLTSPQNAESLDQVRPPTNSAFAAYYHPWLEVLDPLTYTPRLIPPVGHIAAIYARVERERGIHRAPANEPISGILGVQRKLSNLEYQTLADRGINVIRDLTDVRRGIVAWSALTLADDVRWRYVQVRRLCSWVVRSVALHTRWVVNEPNTPALWEEVRLAVEAFLHRLWQQECLHGQTAEQAYLVRCDRSTMSPADVEAGRVILHLAFSPLRPDELYHFQIVQSPQGVQVIES